jgi:Protein of unknown function (DUF2949)
MFQRLQRVGRQMACQMTETTGGTAIEWVHAKSTSLYNCSVSPEIGWVRPMELMMNHPLVRFLSDELALPHESIALAVQHSEQTPSFLPMILWQYGLVSLAQLEQIFDWLEHRHVAPVQHQYDYDQAA